MSVLFITDTLTADLLPIQRTSSGLESFDNLSSNSSQSSKNDTMDDAISNSNFSSTIQTWLRDAVRSQLNNRLYSYYDRPWSNALIPWSLEGIQRDLNRHHRCQETSTAIDVSKILLKNGLLGKRISSRAEETSLGCVCQS